MLGRVTGHAVPVVAVAHRASPAEPRAVPAARSTPRKAGVSMTRAAAVLLALLILGDAITERLSLPIPGAALGLVALAIGFALGGGPDPGSEALFDLAAPYFPLFFVPAAVGVIANIAVISAAWIDVLTALVLGTTVTLVVTGLAFQALLRRLGVDEQP